MKSYRTKFESFLWKIVQMGALPKLQNSIQTLIILWPVYPIHTNSLFWVIFEELPFCHFPSSNIYIRLVDLSFEYPSFSNKRKTTILFLSPLTFLQWPIQYSWMWYSNRLTLLSTCFLCHSKHYLGQQWYLEIPWTSV